MNGEYDNKNFRKLKEDLIAALAGENRAVLAIIKELLEASQGNLVQIEDNTEVVDGGGNLVGISKMLYNQDEDYSYVAAIEQLQRNRTKGSNLVVLDYAEASNADLQAAISSDLSTTYADYSLVSITKSQKADGTEHSAIVTLSAL